MTGVDINTQQSFEALNQRAVAVVIDPVQSVFSCVYDLPPVILRSQIWFANFRWKVKWWLTVFVSSTRNLWC